MLVLSEVIVEISSSRLKHFLALFRRSVQNPGPPLNFAKFIQNIQEAIYLTCSGTPQGPSDEVVCSTTRGKNMREMDVQAEIFPYKSLHTV